MSIQTEIKASHVETTEGFVIAAPSAMAGWRTVGEPFYADGRAARVKAAQFSGATVLPAKITTTTEETRGRVVQRHSIEVDWSACFARKPGQEFWYAVRVAPGAQKMAAKIEASADETDQDAVERESRRGESIVERNLRKKGVDVYMPAFWKELRKHRSRKLVERRLPLLVGYAFIRRDPNAGFYPVRKIDGINGVVATAGVPIPFPEEVMQEIMVAMFDRNQAYKFKRETEIESARFKRRQALNADLGRLLPKGRSRTVSLRYHANECIDKLGDTLRAKVLGIIATLDAVEVDPLDEFREAV